MPQTTRAGLPAQHAHHGAGSDHDDYDDVQVVEDRPSGVSYTLSGTDPLHADHTIMHVRRPGKASSRCRA
eukprot:1159317-Pelagomonas_calceolata.AAC.8